MAKLKSVVIFASSRGDGDTYKLVNFLKENTTLSCLDFNDYEISPYDYLHQNKEDDFIPLMKTILENYDAIIFITPVYWYTMSAQMKIFFDKITDLLTIEKPLGRKLRGKSMAALSTSNGNNLGEQFWLPFEKTAEYLGMNYLGSLHTLNGEGPIQEFLESRNLI
ncbi:MAG: NAD(P)H-dependent oxidoreductase [Saprospiraceae bacterium]